MLEYPEYEWIQKSVDAIREENERVRKLIKKIRDYLEPRKYLFIHENLVRKPTTTLSLEFGLENEKRTLEFKLSED
jgi:hypothetical protein